MPDSLLEKSYLLLVMKAEKGIMPSSVNKKLSTALAEHYLGQFELVSKEEQAKHL